MEAHDTLVAKRVGYTNRGPYDPRSMVRRTTRSLRAYQFCDVTDRDEALLDLARSFRAESEKVCQLGILFLSEELQSTLAGYARMTFVPAESNWVRTPVNTDAYFDNFVRRADVQIMPTSLLKLAWHPDSYLLGVDNYALGYQMLTEVSHRLHSMLRRLSDSLDHLGLPAEDAKHLRDALNPAARLLKKDSFDPTRTSSHLFLRLDSALETRSSEDHKIVGLVIGFFF